MEKRRNKLIREGDREGWGGLKNRRGAYDDIDHVPDGVHVCGSASVCSCEVLSVGLICGDERQTSVLHRNTITSHDQFMMLSQSQWRAFTSSFSYADMDSVSITSLYLLIVALSFTWLKNTSFLLFLEVTTSLHRFVALTKIKLVILLKCHM